MTRQSGTRFDDLLPRQNERPGNETVDRRDRQPQPSDDIRTITASVEAVDSVVMSEHVPGIENGALPGSIGLLVADRDNRFDDNDDGSERAPIDGCENVTFAAFDVDLEEAHGLITDMARCQRVQSHRRDLDDVEGLDVVNGGGKGLTMEGAQVGVGLGDVEGRDSVPCRDGSANVDVGNAIGLEELEVRSRFDVDTTPAASGEQLRDGVLDRVAGTDVNVEPFGFVPQSLPEPDIFAVLRIGDLGHVAPVGHRRVVRVKRVLISRHSPMPLFPRVVPLQGTFCHTLPGDHRGDASPVAAKGAELHGTVMTMLTQEGDSTPRPAVGPTAAALLVGSLLERPVTVVDAGARWGVPTPWTWFGTNAVRVLAFEPDLEEAERLADQYRGDPSVVVVPVALGREGATIPFYVAHDPSGSSIYQPAAAPRPPMSGIARSGWETTFDKVVQVEVVSLDEWLETSGDGPIDAMKMDVQGAELDILKGAPKALESVRMLVAEVHLNKMYEGAALFGEVDGLLREHGFELWRFPVIADYSQEPDRPPMVDRVDVNCLDSLPVAIPALPGQAAWADALVCEAGIREPGLSP